MRYGLLNSVLIGNLVKVRQCTGSYYVQFYLCKGVGMHVCKAGDEETEDVVVDGDDTATFGPAQFHEGDVASAVESSSSEEGKLKHY